MVEGIYNLLHSNYTKPMNLGNPEEIALIDFAKEVIEMSCSENKIVFKPLPVNDPAKRKPDISKAKNIFEKKKFKNYKILNGKKLPKGWSGKVWALYQGIESVKKKYDYFLFIDSDIVISKGLINSAVKYLESKNLLMLSLMAKLKCKTIWEKLLIPSFIFFFQKSVDKSMEING